MLTLPRSIVINHLEENFSDPEIGIAYIYYSYKELDQSVLRLSRSVLQQLAWRRPTLSQRILEIYEKHSVRGSEPTLEEVTTCIKAESQLFRRNFVVIDALDECVEEERSRLFRDGLDAILNCSFLVTSRELPSIAEDLGYFYKLNILATSNDVETYIMDKCQTNSKLKKHISEDPTLKTEILNTIMRNFGGM